MLLAHRPPACPVCVVQPAYRQRKMANDQPQQGKHEQDCRRRNIICCSIQTDNEADDEPAEISSQYSPPVGAARRASMKIDEVLEEQRDRVAELNLPIGRTSPGGAPL